MSGTGTLLTARPECGHGRHTVLAGKGDLPPRNDPLGRSPIHRGKLALASDLSNS